MSCFSTDKTLGTGYNIHLLCDMIADHRTLPAISLLHFWLEGARKKVAILHKNCLSFFNFWQFAGANFKKLFIGTVKMT